MPLKRTPLDALHRELGARMTPFAGYDMPVQYRGGIIAEHRHTREQAGLFDVSHMGQFVLSGRDIAQTLESLAPVDLAGLAPNRQTYALLTHAAGGVRDDMIITRWGAERFFVVVNAACKAEDRAWIEAHLRPEQALQELQDQGLLALQGPAARAVLERVIPGVARLRFMQGANFDFHGEDLFISCSGYTGEDGFELSCGADTTEALARRLLGAAAVAPAGLGARDSLRLEAGLCLYGHELNAQITPIEAGLSWSIDRARRPGGAREGGYPGAAVIGEQLQRGVARQRVGLRVDGKRPVREGQRVMNERAEAVGYVTSGAFGASLGAPLAMALVDVGSAQPGSRLSVDVRGKALAVTVCRLPFVAPRYFRGG